MLKGTRDGILKKVQPTSIHGQISWDVYFTDVEDPDGQVSVARVGPEAVMGNNLEPGDRIQVTNGVLHINGEAVERIRIGDYVKGAHGQYQKGTLYSEKLPNGRRYTVLEYSDNGPSDNTPEFLVPANSFFVMGDNRDDSLDSRTRLTLRDIAGMPRERDELGWYVPDENLVGRAEFIFFSHDPSAAGWTEPWKWPEAIRFSRFFTAIH